MECGHVALGDTGSGHGGSELVLDPGIRVGFSNLNDSISLRF